MKLSTLSIILGLVVVVLNGLALLKPAKFTEAARKFPRSMPIGVLLMLVSTAWFVWNVHGESIADFESLKPFLYALFVAVGVGSCIFVRDFLAARGLAVFILLVAKLMVDTARWVDSEWRVVIVWWAYLLVVAGIWFTISPWRVRDLIQWSTANEKRLKMMSGVRLAFGIFVIVLGLTAF